MNPTSADTPAPSDHLWFQDRAAAYLAGGLMAAEAERFEAHRAACPTCDALLTEMTRMDATTRDLFADILPPAGFEDRLVDRVRDGLKKRRSFAAFPRLAGRHPMVTRAAAAIAATLLVGTCGYFGSHALVSGPRYRASGYIETIPAESHELTVQKDVFAFMEQSDSKERAGASEHFLHNVKTDPTADKSGVAADGAQPTQLTLAALSGTGTLTKSGAGTLVLSAANSFTGGTTVSGGTLSLANAKPSDNFAYYRAYNPAPANLTVNSGGTLDVNGVNQSVTGLAVVNKSGSVANTLNYQDANNAKALAVANYFKPDQSPPASHQWNLQTDAVTLNVETGKPVTPADSYGVAAHAETGRKVTWADGEQRAAGKGEVEFAMRGEKEADNAPAKPPAAPATPPVMTPPVAPTTGTSAIAPRRIIRNGELHFEVDSFDSAALQIANIVGESGGFIDTTNSEKLANGKVEGTVIVRVPPENLDVLVLKLRGLGDLKSQHIAAQDVTKEYTDLESDLKAAQAMETRLLELIKSGNGQIKDLLAAEKELGTWRQKIDGLEGQIRYYNNLISLSTLTIELMERDIRAAYAAMESEQVSAGVETEDVERARTEALKAIEDAKGRVIESDLNKFEAEQFKATIVAEVPANAAGPVIDRLRQLGHVARLDVQRKQTTEGGTVPAPMAAGLKIERRETRFDISLYNLANVAPRETVNVTLACADVEAAYHQILDAAQAEEKPVEGQPVRKVGRVVSSSLNSQRAGLVGGSVLLEVRSDLAPQVEAIIRGAGEVMHLSVTANPDANNVTTAKRGYTVTLDSMSQVPPRESISLAVAARDVPGLYHKLLDKLQGAKTDSRLINSELNEQDQQTVTGTLDFEIARPEAASIDALLDTTGESEVFQRSATRAADVQNTVDSKVRLTLRLINADDLKPRETTTARVEASDVEQSASDIAAAAQVAGGRTVERRLSKEQGGALEAHLTVDVPLASASAVLDRIRNAGTVHEMTSAKNLQVPDGSLSRAEFEVTLGNGQLLVAPEDSISARFHDALQTSVKGLLFVLQYLVVGVVLVAPVILLPWAIWRLVRRGRRQSSTAAASPVAGA